MKFAIASITFLASVCSADLLPPDSFGNRECVPESSIVCVINSTCVANTMYYELSTTFQKINSINVDAGEPGVCVAGRSKGALALAKLKSQANELLGAGVCKIVMDNISP